MIERFEEKVAFIWSIAELLRGDYKASDYGKVILPFVVLRRLDCVLEPTKERVLAERGKLKVKNVDPVLRRAAGQAFYNTSKLDFKKLLGDPEPLARNLRAYIAAFSQNATDVLTNFSFDEEITRLDKANLLYKIVAEFTKIDLHPDVVSNVEMGYIFEELIRRFSEQSNEAAGEHFTPREVIRLMVNLLLAPDTRLLRERGALRTMYDPACGTGGMLSVAEDLLRSLNAHARLELFGQELNPESYAICKSDMMLKGQDPGRIHLGNSFSQDGEAGSRFDYMLSNPPFGVDWKKVEEVITKEHDERGMNGRFGAGLPRINDGSLLFLQHMLAKMKDLASGGSRIAIVFNAAPLFTGGPESGESNIRRWIIENDWLEAVIALPEELFYNTGIATYVWLLTNRKSVQRKGRVQLIDARTLFGKMRKSLGNKRNELMPEHIAAITKLHADFSESDLSKVVTNDALGYQRVVVERPLRLRYEITSDAVAAVRLADQATGDVGQPEGAEKATSGLELNDIGARLEGLVGVTTSDRSELEARLEREVYMADGKVPPRIRRLVLEAVSLRDATAPVVTDERGAPAADPELRMYEDVPLGQDVTEFFEREVRPHASDAWMSTATPKVGYEIPLTKLFYRYRVPRPLADINTEVRELESLIATIVGDLSRVTTATASAPSARQTNPLPWLGTTPNGWLIAPIGARYEIQLGQMLNAERAVGPERCPYLRNVNVQWDRIDLSDVAEMSFGVDARRKFRLRPGDLLVCEGGEIGRAAVWNGQLEECYYQKALHRLRPRGEDVPRYLMYLLWAAAGIGVFEAEGHQSTIIHLTGEMLAALRMPFPPPAEQHRIVRWLDQELAKIDRLIAALGSPLPKLEEYRRALITEAVSGRTAVAT